MKTAEQYNLPETGVVQLPKSADDLRSDIVRLYEQTKPTLQAYQHYAESVAALSLEYHFARIKDRISRVQAVHVEELVLAATLNARETPKMLDTKLEYLETLPLKRIIFDRTKSEFHFFV